MKNELLSTEQVLLNLSLTSQDEVFKEIAKKALALGFITNEKKLIKGFKHRESDATTGFGKQFAIPRCYSSYKRKTFHVRDKVVLKTGIFIVRLSNGVDWKAMDDQPVKFIIALIAPKEKAAEQHLDILSNVASKLKEKTIQTILLTSNDKSKIVSEILK